MPAYVYQPLAYVSNIRLLKLHSADRFEDPLQISIQHHKSWHRQDGDYDAMSYAWGTDLVTEVVSVLQEGKVYSLTIRRNVAEMLRHLRLSRHHRIWNEQWTWIDSICINQNDLHEKESQVGHMGHIFASAASVLIWLGPSDPHAFNNDPEFNSRYLDPMVCDLYPSVDVIRRSWFHRR
jgi:hypothetical protein